ncbi:MAG: pentapeptide repeat-containing protein [Candidatus Aquilonibacter sp.]
MQPSLFEVIARAVIVVLVNGLWQGVAIAALTWLALRLFPRVNASTRYAAWTLALVAVLVVPIVTSLRHISYYTAAPATSTNSTQTATANMPNPAAQTAAAGGTSRSELKHTTASGATYPQGSGLSLPKVPDLHVNVSLFLTTIFLSAWGIAALLLVARLAVALLRLERLKHDALPLGIEYRDQLQQWQRLDPESDVRLCVTGGIEVPVAVGLFDAMVLLPKHLLEQFDAQEIDQISLHELAHLLRHDDWTNGLQRVITSLLFFNPAVWFIARQMDVEREVACDDYVLELTGAVRTYAFCLTKMAEITSWPHQPLAAPGVFTTRKNISIRIERLLRTGRAISSSISPATAGAVAIGLLGGYFVASMLTPEIAFAMPCPPAAPAAPAELPFKATAPKMSVSLPQVSLTIPNVDIVASKAAKAATKATVVSHEAAAKAALAAASNAIAYNATKASMEAAQQATRVLSMVPGKIALRGSGAGMNCSGCDFGGQNLSGKNFSGSNMTGSDFSKANLQGANFNGANLSGVDFEDADLRNASFVGANLSGANLDNAKLDGANLDGANLSGADLNPRTLSQMQIRAYLPHCHGCDLSGANLSGMDLSGIKLVGIDMSKANLRGANLSKAIFSGVDFSGADLRGAKTDGTQFIGCDFSGAQLGNP